MAAAGSPITKPVNRAGGGGIKREKRGDKERKGRDKERKGGKTGKGRGVKKREGRQQVELWCRERARRFFGELLLAKQTAMR